MEAWAGDCKTIYIYVAPGDEQYAGDLIKFMHTEIVPYSAGSDIVKLLPLAHEYLVAECEAQCIKLLREVSLCFLHSTFEVPAEYH